MTYCHQNKALAVWGVVLSLLFSFAVHAKSPRAGTLIQNQASATYKDADGVEQTATSNVVATLIQQVAAMELVQGQTRYGVAGNTVYLPHVLTNTGNSVDRYDLSVLNLSGDDYDFTTVLIYADKDKDGLPDSTTPITSTGPLDSDEAFYFVLGAEIPTAAINNQKGNLTIKGTSTFIETPTDVVIEKVNTDTVIVSDDAVIQVVKSMSANEGASPSGVYTITLSYENKGVAAATNVVLTDNLPLGMMYNGGKAFWSETGSSPLTDANATDAQGTAPNTIIYFTDTTNPRHSVSATLAQVAAGASGAITFEVNIETGLAASTLINIAEFVYHNGSSPIPSTPTNQVPFDILQTPAVVANGSTTNATDGTDNRNGTTDAFIVAAVSYGATVAFDNIIRNTGNSDDVFDITIDEVADTFPAGTVFQLFQKDGFTPLMDSNNNGTVDTGILAQNASYKVVLKAILPNNISGNNGGAGFKITKTATSSIDSSVFNTVIDHLEEITGDAVDLTNNAAGNAGDGVGIGPEVSAVTTQNVVSGGQAVFRLFINNNGTANASYAVEYSTKMPFEAGFVEAGWTVVFHHEGGNGDCSTLGVVSSVTNTINAGGAQQMCAVITAPTNAIADGNKHPFYFKASSHLTHVFDIKHDAVVVTEQSALSMAPDQIGQVEPGGTVVYRHRVTNNGNTALECITVTSVDADLQSGWSSVIYKDVNEDGKLDAGDTPLVNQTLDAQQSFSLLIKLFAPATASMGLKNIQLLTVTGYKENGDANPTTCTGTPLSDKVQDVTTVNTSKMSIIKEQAIDALCDGVADTAFSTTAFQVQPGACVFYRLTATNIGATAVKNARIDDATPTFTLFFGTSNSSAGNIVGGVVGTEGTIAGGSLGGASITLQSGETLVLTFGVKVD